MSIEAFPAAPSARQMLAAGHQHMTPEQPAELAPAAPAPETKTEPTPLSASERLATASTDQAPHAPPAIVEAFTPYGRGGYGGFGYGGFVSHPKFPERKRGSDDAQASG